jgi:hypothetical protein
VETSRKLLDGESLVSFREVGLGGFMPYRKDAFVSEGCYHIFNRGANRNNISKLMQGMTSAYTQAFNIQQKRTGTLFEGRFKHVEES